MAGPERPSDTWDPYSTMRSPSRRPECFDEVAEIYDRARSGYLPALIDDLVDLTGLGPGSRILEIGCGTGQLSIPLAERGVSLLAVELGPRLAAIARRNLARFPEAEVVVAAFETWPLPSEPFDVVVSATAFHWLDPAIRVSKCAQALSPSGALAVIDGHHIAGGTEQFFVDNQACYVEWVPDTEDGFRVPTTAQISVAREEMDQSPLFRYVELRRYEDDHSFTTQEFIDLLQTDSLIRGLHPKARLGFLDCIADLIEEPYGGRIVRRRLTELRVAQK
jgi:SAM-dependent methyltransferase